MDWEERGKLVKALQDGVENDKIQDSGFFNRKRELKALLASLATEADNVTVVVGPNNCGKTLLLKRLKAVWRSEKEFAATSPVFYFDLRKQVWRTPGEAASHLARKFKSWQDVFLQWADAVKSGVSGVTIKPTVNRSIIAEIALKTITDVFPLLGGSSGSDLARVMDAFCTVLHKSKLVHPIFILDEANKLADWNRQDVAALAGFFKSLVKQDRKAYLILSSCAFKSWLRQMFNADEWRAFGVGFFPETDARRFFTGISIPRAFGPMPQTFQDSDWQAVYAVCGGSPLLLNQCAKTALVCELSWQEAVETLMRNALLVVESGMNAKHDMGFDGENYRSISKVIVEQGFMGVNAALKNIYKGDAKQCMAEILAMLDGNLIHLRYMTPAARYGDINWTDTGKEHEIITARSPAERAAMKEFLGLNFSLL